MKQKTIITITMMLVCSFSAFAQIKSEKFGPFIGKQEIISSSGPGLTQASGDILLELSAQDDPDVETLLLLRNTKGNLTKIAENSSLLMGHEMLGVSGGNYPHLSGNTLSVDYSLGSNSAQSDISIVFEKSSDGNYYLKEYISATRNYGVENLFARQKITAQQTGKIKFLEADENMILNKAKINPSADNAGEPVYKAEQQYAKYIPEGWQLAAFAEGDLNLDGSKKDLLLVLDNEDACCIQLLLQQKDDSYKVIQTNATLIARDETFNTNNLKAIIKNGYFTIEQRIAVSDDAFDHRYITLKYNALQKNWYLYRYDAEHYSGFNPKPAADVTHLTQQHFGTIPFEKLDYTPGDYYYEPAIATISGMLTKKQFYGPPNYGETPEKDEKVSVYILKPDYPVNVMATADQPDPETADKTIRSLTEIQVYTTDKNLALPKYFNKKITLQGTLMQGRTGHHYTKVLMEAKKIIQ